MRSPRMIYLAVAAVLIVAGFVLTDYIADRSAPDLGDGVVLVPVGNPTTAMPTSTPTVGPTGAPTKRQTEAVPVSPPPVPTAGDDDDNDPDDIDDD